MSTPEYDAFNRMKEEARKHGRSVVLGEIVYGKNVDLLPKRLVKWKNGATK